MHHKIKNNSDRIQAVPGFPAFNPGEIRSFTKEDAEILKANPYLTEVQRGGAETSEEDESVKEEKPKGTKRKNSI